jgi:lipid-A-disaccharide synthase
LGAETIAYPKFSGGRIIYHNKDDVRRRCPECFAAPVFFCCQESHEGCPGHLAYYSGNDHYCRHSFLMKYYIIAGEASGDLHASNLMKELKKQDPQALFRCWGGDRMHQQGGELVRHYRDLSFMGFLEVLLHLRTITSNLAFCKQDILEYHPDVLILVDYPGFNLRIAGFAHSKKIKVFYYISPQLWAWHSSRVRIIRESVDKMFVILPFEKEFYKRHDFNADFAGHPLLDEINGDTVFTDRQSFLHENGLNEELPIVALLPGSRKQEIREVLRIMLSAIPDFKDHQFVFAGAPSIDSDFYKELIGERPVKVIHANTYDLLHHSEAAVVTSGTATLETALLGIPQVVVYKGGRISYQLARMVVNVKFISLVNLIMGEEVVKELIQGDLTPFNISMELRKILFDTGSRNRMVAAYNSLREKLGGRGASEKVARLMIQYLQQK